MEKENIQKEFLFQEVSNSYRDYKMIVPSGYEFFHFLERETSNGYSTILAVFIAYQPLKDKVKEMEKENSERLEKFKKELENNFTKRVGTMQLEERFSDVLKKFKIGDTVYYYQDGYGVQEKIEDHIKSLTLSEVILYREEVRVNGNKQVYDEQLSLRGWNENTKTENAFKTRDEAIVGKKEYHENRLREKKEKDKKDKIAFEEKKKLEEVEILRKAEEIKNKHL